MEGDGFGQSASGATATVEKYATMSRGELAEHARQIQTTNFADLPPPLREELEPIWNALIERVDTAQDVEP